MLSRTWCRAASLLLLLAFFGCNPAPISEVDEQKNPFFVAGKERIASRDYKGAIDAFEKALETHPKSVLAHFELGVLYEQHSDQKDSDYMAAMYHYQQVIRLRPNEYPADNARQRIAGCKQELVKGEALAPVAQSLVRENERLKEENRTLQKQLTAFRVEAARVPPASIPPATLATGREASVTRASTDTTATVAAAVPSSGSAKSHRVQPGDTVYSIARRYRVSQQALQAANPRVDPKQLKIGQVLAIPTS